MPASTRTRAPADAHNFLMAGSPSLLRINFGPPCRIISFARAFTLCKSSVPFDLSTWHTNQWDWEFLPHKIGLARWPSIPTSSSAAPPRAFALRNP